MNLINSQTGDNIWCEIDSHNGESRTFKRKPVNVHGKIKREGELLFICQDEVCSGSMAEGLKDKLGFKEAWYVGKGTNQDLKDWGVEIIELQNYNQNYERIS